VSIETENPGLLHSEPDEFGHFGPYGGTYVSETLIHALDELKEAYDRWRRDDEFMQRLDSDLAHYVGRPSPIYFAQRLTELAGGARIILKREDLNHTGAHKINNTVGQGLLAHYMGKSRIIARVAWCTWARWTSIARPSMFSACACSAPKCVLSLQAQRL